MQVLEVTALDTWDNNKRVPLPFKADPVTGRVSFPDLPPSEDPDNPRYQQVEVMYRAPAQFHSNRQERRRQAALVRRGRSAA